MAGKKPSKLKVLTAGIIRENPVLVLILGTCPTLAVTTSATNGAGMGLAAAIVLIGSNVVIAALRNLIPDKVRIPCYIVVIASFTTLIEMLFEAFIPDLYEALGLFLSLVVVNCIILGRAEAFASKNTIVDSLLDGVGMSIGFTFALLFMGSIREILGSGTWFGMQVFPEGATTISIMTLAPGGFFTYGCIIALINKLTKGRAIKKKDFDCESCGGCAGGSCTGCAKAEGGSAK
ncbi:MAG TPA: electron transport complex subunit E [Candidatus Alectryocaccobium stercorigallinarum]|jgi:electron transport complex protein RnfE|nr:electron transport complex subunit E [Candidatus Alectryocaccobium stercorigallinarum]